MTQKVEKYLASRHDIESVAYCGALGAIIAQLKIMCQILDECPFGDLLSKTKGHLALVVIDLEKSHKLMVELLTENMRKSAGQGEAK